MQIAISRQLVDQVVTLAIDRDEEICGLLLGDGIVVTHILPAANVARDRSRHFELDPATLITAHRAARAGGATVMGHYHSHPSGRAAPSATDLACAVADGSLWLIVAGADATLWRALSNAHGKPYFAPVDMPG